jgi:hypothetical protein
MPFFPHMRVVAPTDFRKHVPHGVVAPTDYRRFRGLGNGLGPEYGGTIQESIGSLVQVWTMGPFSTQRSTGTHGPGSITGTYYCDDDQCPDYRALVFTAKWFVPGALLLGGLAGYFFKKWRG